LLVHYPDGDENAGKLMYASISLNDYPIILMDGPGKQGIHSMKEYRWL
jgi:hypothetical protein